MAPKERIRNQIPCAECSEWGPYSRMIVSTRERHLDDRGRMRRLCPQCELRLRLAEGKEATLAAIQGEINRAAAETRATTRYGMVREAFAVKAEQRRRHGGRRRFS